MFHGIGGGPFGAQAIRNVDVRHVAVCQKGQTLPELMDRRCSINRTELDEAAHEKRESVSR
jgi:hypothetical protein